MPEPVSLAAVLDAAIRGALAHVHTGLPAKVLSYNPATNTIDAEIVVKQGFFDSDGERTFEELPIIPSVPVMWPRGGGMVASLPLESGDFVWLMFSQAGLAEWRATGQLSEPQDARRHSIGYPYAVPGAFPDVQPLDPFDVTERTAGAAIIGEDGGANQLLIGGTIPGFRFGKLAVSPVALATPLLAYVSAAAAAATAGGASDSSVASALSAIQAALVAIVAIPANAAAAAAVTASGTAVSAAVTATGTSATAATTAATAATTAAGAVPSTLVKAL